MLVKRAMKRRKRKVWFIDSTCQAISVSWLMRVLLRIVHTLRMMEESRRRTRATARRTEAMSSELFMVFCAEGRDGGKGESKENRRVTDGERRVGQ